MKRPSLTDAVLYPVWGWGNLIVLGVRESGFKGIWVQLFPLSRGTEERKSLNLTEIIPLWAYEQERQVVRPPTKQSCIPTLRRISFQYKLSAMTYDLSLPYIQTYFFCFSLLQGAPRKPS